MIRFLLKTCLLVSVLFIGIIIGFQEANNGLHKMKGYDDPNFKGALSIDENLSGEYEATILGETIPSHNLEDKQKLLEELNNFNFFTNIAKSISNFLSSLSEKIFSG